jgi:hypothetical protein
MADVSCNFADSIGRRANDNILLLREVFPPVEGQWLTRQDATAAPVPNIFVHIVLHLIFYTGRERMRGGHVWLLP